MAFIKYSEANLELVEDEAPAWLKDVQAQEEKERIEKAETKEKESTEE